MKFFKNFSLQKLIFAEPKDVGKDNAIDKFLNTLNTEDKEKDFIDFSPSQKINYTKAMYDFQVEAMGDLSEAVFKAVTMFAVKLHKQNIDNFTFEQTFYGSKDNVKEELFSITFKRTDKINQVKTMAEYADEKSRMPRKKHECLYEQSDIVLDIVENLEGQFSMNKRNELPLRASCILLVAEFMSQCNLKTLDLGLEKLMEADTDLHTSYTVEARRKEFVLTPDSFPKKKF